MRACRYCARTLTKRTQQVYCSLACMQAERRSKLTLKWLATGEGSPGTHRDHYLRTHLAEEQDGFCAICGLPDEWQSQPLSFILDHVDGNSENHQRANLRLICPNCDSQLPTFKSRNRGNGRHRRREQYAEGKSF